jgi:hypothetical protein
MVRELLLNMETLRLRSRVVAFRFNAIRLRFSGAKTSEKTLVRVFLSVIGSGSVVNCDVPEYVIYAGAPGLPVSSGK